MAIWSGRSLLSVLAWAVHDEPLTCGLLVGWLLCFPLLSYYSYALWQYPLNSFRDTVVSTPGGRKTWPPRLSYELEPEDDSSDTDSISVSDNFCLKYPVSISLFIADPQLVAVSPRTALSSGRNLTHSPWKCGPKLR
ncbi:hypothetical protein B0H16DRAFT_1518469 [Mycena metata]|uniref:Uncharacterized protein n=1 Tax=Mycena metata TaxID=1033252 RepID=A0AAD7JNX6_9AGAR|nr:hypothetical protein B0H16DRAFT_1518469 [Mycena metata]